MVLPDTKIYKALSSNTELINTIQSMRQTSTDAPMIFNQSIPEGYQASKFAPLVRVNYVGSTYRASDDDQSVLRPQVLVSFWTKKLSQGEKLLPIIKHTLRDINYYPYSENHEEDPDTGDQLENRMYIFRVYVHGIEIEEE